MTSLDQPAPSRILGVFPHPDDETLTAGGLVAYLAAGADVTIITTNRGERGKVIPAELAHLENDNAGLGAVRERELAGAIDALGVQHHHFLDRLPGLENERPERYHDSGMQWAPESHVRAEPAADAPANAFSLADVEVAARLLAAFIREQQFELVITEEPDGGYGHPDHVRCHDVTKRAVELAATAPSGSFGAASASGETAADGGATVPGEVWRVPVLAWAVRSESVARGGLQWLADNPHTPSVASNGATLVLPAPTDALPSIVIPDSEVDVEVDATAVLPRVLRAIQCHYTQAHEAALDPNFVPVPNGDPAAGWQSGSNNYLQPIPTKCALKVAPGWGSREDVQRLVGRVARAAGLPVPGGAAGAATAAGATVGLATHAATPDAAPAAAAPRWYQPAMVAFSGVLGVVLGATGTAFHRWQAPWGLVIGLAALLAGGVLSRTFADRTGMAVFAIAAVVLVFAMTYYRPGGDLAVLDDALGTGWLFGSVGAVVTGALVPRRWFRDTV